MVIQLVGIVMFSSLITLSLLLLSTGIPKIIRFIKTFVFSIVFDVALLPLITIMVNVGTCSGGAMHYSIDNGGKTCLCPEYFWYYVLMGFLGFTIMYLKGVHYQKTLATTTSKEPFKFKKSFIVLLILVITGTSRSP